MSDFYLTNNEVLVVSTMLTFLMGIFWGPMGARYIWHMSLR